MNAAGLNLIKSFEGCKLKAYQDIVGVWTIGYGTTGPDVSEGLEITQEEAEKRLLADVEVFERGVSRLVKVPLTENQLAALTSFAYNLGLGALGKSTLLMLLNEGKYEAAALEFGKWSRAGGQVVPGLVRRREAERTLFLLDDSHA